MGFLDEAVITVRSGDGGRGCVSFRREKYEPRGGPDGGDGGDGGNVVLRASRKLHTLTNYISRKHFKAPNGQPGRGKNQSGKSGADLFLEVPLGTLVREHGSGDVLVDLTRDGQEFLVAPGGKGGRGNQHYATPTRRTPRVAQPGTPGREEKLRLSLKFLADIGLIGLPNAGKSTLLSRLTTAHPKIDNYPFTTLVPNLGVLLLDEKPLTVADIPGLIQGASEGKGLGLRFLRHIERTKLLLHLLDVTHRPSNGPLDDFHAVREEMAAYNPELMNKPQIVLINKVDLRGPGHRDPEALKGMLDEIGVKALTVSAVTGEGLEEVKTEIAAFFGNDPEFETGNPHLGS